MALLPFDRKFTHPAIWWCRGNYCGVIHMEKFSLFLLVSLEWLLFALTLGFFSSLRGLYCVFKYCIINNICLSAVLWSIFHVHHSLCSTSWISSRDLPSPLLPQWLSPKRSMAGPRLLIHRRNQKCFPRSSQDSLVMRISEAAVGKQYFPKDELYTRGFRAQNHKLLTIFCDSFVSFKSPPPLLQILSFICSMSRK